MTKTLSQQQFNEIIALVKQGEVVAFPTDTVFGVGVRYDDLNAIKKMRIAKQRDANKPFPLMVASVDQLDTVSYIGERERKIASFFMPGALTLILKKKECISNEATLGKDTIAIRIPNDEFALKLLNAVGPMWVTSANMSNSEECNNDKEVLAQLDNRISAVVKGEAKSHISSTIIDCTGSELKCLRQGEITLEDILKKIGGNN